MAQRAHWGSRLGFILAASGSAVGLGNIWRFPYATGENGGGWFVLIYLVCVALIGVPVMMSEIMIGRAAQRQPVVAFRELQGGPTPWAGVGWLGLIAAFVILSYYIVIAGWAMDYTLKSFVNVAEPVHDAAELESTKYRATATLEEMRMRLVVSKAEKDARDPVARLRNEVKPSVWDVYDTYRAALDEAGVPDPVRIETVLAVWDGGELDGAAILGPGLDRHQLERPITERERERYGAVRVRLLEKAEYEEKVGLAEGLQERIEIARRTSWREAVAHYGSLPDVEIRNEAEDLVRRDVIRERVQSSFGAVAGDGWMTMFWTLLFMLLTTAIVAGGIARGIERACLVLMPILFLLIIVLVIYGMFTPGFGEAIVFVFKPDATKLQPSGVLSAMGQAFFSLSLGLGAMITYGSYLKTKKSLAGQSVTIAGMDTVVALLACGMIFPIVFSYGQEPTAGPGLVFMTMPMAFAEIGRAGMLVGATFFGLLVFAAITSSISVLEVVASYFIDDRGWSRPKATWILGGLVFLMSFPSAFAGDPGFAMSGWLASYGNGLDFLTTVDFLATNWMLPTGGFFISVYAGWVMPRRLREAECADLARPLFLAWLLLVRIIAPAMIIVVLMQSIGILDADELLHGLFH